MKLTEHIAENWRKETISAAKNNKANTLAEAKTKVSQNKIIARERINQQISAFKIKLKEMQAAKLNNSKNPVKK
jgi:hypothetical protein